ncbi:patatin-like protein 4 [Cicer arietinum]|uniref:Patatin n=1 Tax=Cicer arietinum TaxID=3827 RepID=A0A1S2Z5A6_CICAR|nr:patatin-like protein 4 [Cicer arietinum]
MGAFNFLLLVFVFGSQVIGGLNTKLPPPSYGNTISILSIDGGGMKGIIPTTILYNLEKALQIVSKDEKAALADYFDVIAGTSTGGLVTGMLSTPHPDDPSRPAFTPLEIFNFYIKYGPSIFNQSSASGWNENSTRPKYDGEFLHSKTREILGEFRLHDTLTNVVIPTYDIKKVHPIIFSSFKVKEVPSIDIKLSEIILGTSAAPIQLPPIYFKDGPNEFNLVDGGVVAASPAFVAVSEVIQQLEEKNVDFIPMKANEPTKIVLLSLGCGSTKVEGVDARIAQFFPSTIWAKLLFLGLAGSAGDMNQYYLSSIFPDSSDNYYLRIEEYNLDPSILSDDAGEENLEKLVNVGENLLEQIVKKVNTTSFVPYEEPNEGTNAEALKRLAEILYTEKQLRLKMKSMEKRGRPFIEAITSPMK